MLINEYGNEFRVSNCYIEKLEKWPIIKNDDAKALEDLSLFLIDCNHYLENMCNTNQLQSPTEIMNIVNKLPYKLRDRWRRRCHSVMTIRGKVAFKDLVDFVQQEAAILRHPIYGCIDNYTGANAKSTAKSRRTILSTQVTTNESPATSNQVSTKFL